MWTEADGTHILTQNQELFEEGIDSYSNDRLRSIFQGAGVHIYDRSGDVLYVGRDWICVHTVQAGEKSIELPFDARVIDPVTDEILYRSTRTIDFEMGVNSTVIFRVEPLP